MNTSPRPRAMLPRKAPRLRLSRILAILALLAPYTTSWGDGGVHFTLVNRTRQYLHALINNRPILYIGPGAAISYEVDRLADLEVDVTYSPGQGLTGHAVKNVKVELETSATSSTTNDCSNGDNTCTSSTSASATSRYIVTPARWEVAAADLAAADSAGGQP